MNALELAALLSSRLCHDLVGPIGALNNGLEILVDETDPEMRRRAIDLMLHSAGEAARRLRFYRLAFGASGGEGASIGLGEARDAAQGLFETSKITLDWPDAFVGSELVTDKGAVKLLLNMIAVGGEALARGGTLSVSLNGEDGSLHLMVVATGPGANLRDETRQLLAEKGDLVEPDPRSIQPFFTARLAGALGTSVSVRARKVGRVEIGAVLDNTSGR